MVAKFGAFTKAKLLSEYIRFLKQILGVRQQTSNMILYGELGRVPLYVLRKVRIVNYWY